MVKRNERGITLIALVITIIILIILAGVSLNILLGKNGIISRTQTTKEQYEYEASKEIINLKLAEIYTDSISKNEEYTMSKIAIGMTNDTSITIDEKYFNSTGSLKTGVSDSIVNLKGIVVSVNQYERFKFLIGEKNDTNQIIGYTTESIPDTWTTGDLPTGFKAIGEGKQVIPEESEISPTAKTYIVTFKDGETILSTETVEEGKNATKPTDPSKDDYKFIDWYSDSSLTTEYDFTSTVTGNTTIYAKWLRNLTVKVGDTVNYSTTHNDVTLNTWRVFHIDRENSKVWIILSDYLPYNAIGVGTGEGKISGLGLGNTSGTNYCVKGDSQQELLNAMKSANWISLKTGTLNGVNVPIEKVLDAMGSPDLELWSESYNENSDGTIYIKWDSEKQGYYVSTTDENPTTEQTTVLNSGKLYSLYFPHTSSYCECYGTWLASPSAKEGGYVMRTGYNGNITPGLYNDTYRSLRPVICLNEDLFY